MSDEQIKAYGIIMDWSLGDDGIVTLTCFETGDASMYLSSGGGIIGGGKHENVSNAVIQYLKIGQKYLEKAEKIIETPLPDKDMINFYFLTNNGKYLGQESISNIENESSKWLGLFYEANKVLTELNLLSNDE